MPVGIVPGTPIRTSFDLRLAWTLRDASDRSLSERAKTISASAIEAVAGCAIPDADPVTAQLRAATELAEATLRRDVFAPEALEEAARRAQRRPSDDVERCAARLAP